MNKLINSAEKKGLFFLHHELRIYQWYSNLLPFFAAVSQVALLVILMILPKFVLDAVQTGMYFYDFMKTIMLVCVVFIVLTLANMYFHNQVTKISQTFLYRRLNSLWEKKMLSMKFEVLVSEEGKIKIEKARQHITSPNWGIVELLVKETAVLEAILGLFLYSLVVGKLHILMLLFLGVLFLAELFVGLRIEKKKACYKKERAKADRRINYIAYGTRGIEEAKDIRIFSMLPMLRQITNTVIQRKCKVESDIQRWQFLRMFITAALIFIRDGVGYIFLIYLFLKNDMSIGDFSMYFTAISGIGMWLTKIADSYSNYKEVVGYTEDFYEFMKLPDDETDKEECSFFAPVSFEFRNVYYSYHIVNDGEEQVIPVIKGMNFKVRAGEKIAIVGKNGAGKSTLIKILCGMLTPDKGEIFINGRDISKIQKKDYYSLFSAVFQNSKLLPVSIAENITLKSAKYEYSEIWQILQTVGLEKQVQSLSDKEQTDMVKNVTGGVDFSGGQEQKLLLARAVYKNASVLVLDEPTAALDPISENEIYQRYNELTLGKTAFFVSHRLASTRFCDRILFVEDGRIGEEGSHKELMELDGKYADMFKVQSKYYAEKTEVV